MGLLRQPAHHQAQAQDRAEAQAWERGSRRRYRRQYRHKGTWWVTSCNLWLSCVFRYENVIQGNHTTPVNMGLIAFVPLQRMISMAFQLFLKFPDALLQGFDCEVK